MSIAGWLRTLNLEQYEQAFNDNAIDIEVLSALNEADLEKVGVLLGHRKKLLKAITDLSVETAFRAGSIAAVQSARTVVSAPATPPSEAERRQLTVMFVDMVGSTALSRRLDPEEMNGLIRSYQNTVAGEVARFEGHVAKLMGDGVLCYFGWPRAHEDDAERAVRGGLAVVHAVGALKVPDGGSLSARVGIATGLVVVGDLMGEGSAQERAVTGETPNLAARLQAAAQAGEVLVADSTRRLVGELFVLRDRGEIALKGYDAGLRAYVALEARAPESRFGALHQATLTPLVAREQELALLLDQWDQAKSGNGRVVLLAGDPGIGKSRLIAELKSKLVNLCSAILEYQCSSLYTQSTLHPFAAELERAAGFCRDDDAVVRHDKLETLLAGRLNDAASALPLLARLLALPDVGQLSADLTPQQRKAKTLAILGAQIEHLALRHPLLLVFEDAHWADPTSLELLTSLVDAVTRLPILLIVSHRPEFSPSWADLPHIITVTLSRLHRREAAALVEHIAGCGRLPSEAADRIVSRADGIPLFVEELTRAMLEDVCTIPSTLQDLLSARLDRLGSAKPILQIGSAIGREFSYELVAAVSAPRDASLDTELERAAESGLIVREGAGRSAIYRFRHALVQEAAYASVLRSRRRSLHGRIARAIEKRAPEARETHPERVAWHYAEAGSVDRAAALWLEAGRRAKDTFATSEAATHLRSCVAAIANVAEAAPDVLSGLRRVHAEALVMLGDLASLSEDLAAADQYYRQAIEQASEGDLRRRIENKRHRQKATARGGAQIAYYEHGAGDTTLLFVSTQALGIAAFQPILDRLCDEFRIVVVDPRGSGGSDPLTRPYTLADHTADVRAVIAELGAGPLVGVGVSLAANLLLQIAHAEPALLDRIVAVGAPIAGRRTPFFSKDWLEQVERARLGGDIEPMIRLHIRLVFSEPEMREMLETIVRARLRQPQETLLSFFDEDPAHDLTPILPMVRTRTLIMHGRSDQLVSFAAAELAASLLPNSTLHGFEGKGHVPIFTAIDEFCARLRAFARGEDRETGASRPTEDERACEIAGAGCCAPPGTLDR